MGPLARSRADTHEPGPKSTHAAPLPSLQQHYPPSNIDYPTPQVSSVWSADGWADHGSTCPPSQLATFVEQGLAAGHGPVYIAMGTAARLTEAELHSLASSLSALPNPVLCKGSCHRPAKSEPRLAKPITLMSLFSQEECSCYLCL